MKEKRYRESLSFVRLMMVLSSFTPLFILWAIQGTKCIDDIYFIPFCAVMVTLPNIILLTRIKTASHKNDCKKIHVGRCEDHREHLLIYLFTTLLPFYALSVETTRDFALIVVALSFIVFVFWYANLHYMNVIFALAGYRIYTIYSNDSNQYSGKGCIVLITGKVNLQPDEEVIAYRLSDTVYYEEIK